MHTIGTKTWLLQSHGRLSFKNKAQLISSTLLPTIHQLSKMHWAARPKNSKQPTVYLSVESLQLPDSKDTQLALEELQDCSREAIQNHSIRMWFYAAAFARTANLPIDRELLAVGCLLHDLGATEKYHQHHPECQCFAGQGAYAAVDWAAQQGWPMSKQDILFDMICLHMNGDVPLSQGTEAHLLQQAASCDVIGTRMQQLPASYRQAVLAAYPRLQFNEEFIAFVKREAKARPQSRAALLLSMGFEMYVKTNPFLGSL